MKTTPTSHPTNAHQERQRQRRLRSVVKRLVIELAHLEHCLAEGLQDPHVQRATINIDRAIDHLNEYLASERDRRAA